MPTPAAVDATPAGALLVALERSLARRTGEALGERALDVARGTVAAVLGGRRPDAPTAADAQVRDLAEQFVLDANGIERSAGRALRDRAGRAGAVAAVTWMGLVESRERLGILLADGSPDGASHGDGVDVGIASPRPERAVADDGVGHPWPSDREGPDPAPPTLQELLAATVPDAAGIRAELGALPPGPLPAQARELVRLTSADAVDCRYCRNVRYRDASGRALVDEATRSALGDGASGEALGSTAAATAVDVARAFLAARPLTPADLATAEGELGREAFLDLLVTVQRFPAGSKAMVALGLVPERTPLTYL